VLVEDWRQDYDQRRPHSALGMMTPIAFAAGYRTYVETVGEHVSPLGGSEQWLAGTTTIANHQLSKQVDR
jgi:Integrase core domain